jgi:probable rRNA maturation factor
MPVTIELSPRDAELIGRQFLDTFESVFPSLLPHGSYTIEVTLYDRQAMQKLNRETRSIDAPTDVLSYPTLNSLDEVSAILTEENEALPLGSIIICPDKAQEYEETLWELLCHGFLHLLGADHETNVLYWKKQEETLRTLLINHHVPYRGLNIH